jgi:type IV pilus assembly protein PilV
MRRTPRRTTLRRSGPEQGFTVLEVLIALSILLIGILGLLSMQLSSMRAAAFSRHATEATAIASDTMESLRTVALDSLVYSAPHPVDAQGIDDDDGAYTVTWGPIINGSETSITVTVTWQEGPDLHTFQMTSVRTQ